MDIDAISILIAAVVSAASTQPIIRSLKRYNVVDIAEERSAHQGKAIRGVGIATTLGFIAGLVFSMWTLPPREIALIACIGGATSLAALIGAIEDFRGLSIIKRAGLQLSVGVLGCLAIFIVLDSPLWFTVPAGIGVAWYVNAANFMDGLNGMSGIHGFVVGASYCVLGIILEHDWLVVAGGVLSVVFLTFLPWNFSRRKLFLGDCGSYLLGAGIAFVAVGAFAGGIHPIVVIGPLVIYTLDTATTLIGRIVSGKTWYQSHREHIYQRLNTLGVSHLATSLTVGLCTLACGAFGLVFLQDNQSVQAVGSLGIVVVCLLYLWLPRLFRFKGEEATLQ